MTRNELRKQVEKLPDPIRVKIVHHLAEALCEINAAEHLMIQHGLVGASDLPALSGSLNTSMTTLQQIFDF